MSDRTERSHTKDHAKPITRGDIEAKFAEIKGELETTAESAKSMAVTVGAAVAVVVVITVFLLGRRRGHKKTTFIEVRRL